MSVSTTEHGNTTFAIVCKANHIHCDAKILIIQHCGFDLWPFSCARSRPVTCYRATYSLDSWLQPFVIMVALWFLSSFFFSSPNLSGRRLDVYLPYFHTWCGLSANLECTSEMCCKRLAENTGRKNRHLGTIAHICRAVSSQMRHASTTGKNLLNSDTSSTCPHNMVNFGILTAEICRRVCSTPANFNGFRVLAALLF